MKPDDRARLSPASTTCCRRARSRSWTRDLAGRSADRHSVALVLLQPDLGTALAVAVGGVTVMFLAGLPLRLFVGARRRGDGRAPLAYIFAAHDYQRAARDDLLRPRERSARHRLSHQPVEDRDRLGRDRRQRLPATGRRAISTILPEPHTDFMFATMAEEWGLLGGLFVHARFRARRCAGASASRSTRARQVRAGCRGRAWPRRSSSTSRST